MTQAKLARYRDLARVAEAAGFAWVRREGSHGIFRNAAGRVTVIPNQESADRSRVVDQILRQPDLRVDEYHRLLGR